MARVAWLPMVAAVVGVAVFSALGFWQLQRAAQKRDRLAAIERGASAPAIALPRGREDLADAAYRRVRVQGRFLARRQFLFDNRIHDNRVGYDVLTPLVLEDGRTILVDRGWIPMAPTREPLKPIGIEIAGSVTVTGRLWLPEEGVPIGPAVARAPDGAWPRTVTRIDYDALAADLGRTLVPAIIRVDGDQPWAFEPRQLEPRLGIRKHYGYAAQWFAIALTVVIIAVALTRRRRAADAPDG